MFSAFFSKSTFRHCQRRVFALGLLLVLLNAQTLQATNLDPAECPQVVLGYAGSVWEIIRVLRTLPLEKAQLQQFGMLLKERAAFWERTQSNVGLFRLRKVLSWALELKGWNEDLIEFHDGKIQAVWITRSTPASVQMRNSEMSTAALGGGRFLKDRATVASTLVSEFEKFLNEGRCRAAGFFSFLRAYLRNHVPVRWDRGSLFVAAGRVLTEEESRAIYQAKERFQAESAWGGLLPMEPALLTPDQQRIVEADIRSIAGLSKAEATSILHMVFRPQPVRVLPGIHELKRARRFRDSALLEQWTMEPSSIEIRESQLRTFAGKYLLIYDLSRVPADQWKMLGETLFAASGVHQVLSGVHLDILTEVAESLPRRLVLFHEHIVNPESAPDLLKIEINPSLPLAVGRRVRPSSEALSPGLTDSLLRDRRLSHHLKKPLDIAIRTFHLLGLPLPVAVTNYVLQLERFRAALH